MSQKIRQDKHFELYQAFLIKCSNTFKLYTTDASKALLSSKIPPSPRMLRFKH